MNELQLTLNTIWVIFAASLVFFMQAGFAMLESGMVRSKNSVNVIMKNYIDMAFCALAFWLVGYGLMFGSNPTGFFGTDHFILHDADSWSYTVLLFQIMFAATAATIVSGALAERIRYWPYLISAIFISSFIYPLFGSWVWGGSSDDNTMGWLKTLGFIDFSGSSVVHAIGGWCALAGVIVLKPRLGRFDKIRRSTTKTAARTEEKKNKQHSIPGHNLPMVALGGFILWFGWFGFNGGSLLEANASIGKIILNTHLSGAAGVFGAMLLLLIMRKPLLLTRGINGGLGGLVAICAGCAFMDPPFAVLTGFIAGMITVFGSFLLERLRLDDAVDAVSVHAFAGTWGVLAVGLFHTEQLFNGKQLAIQALGAGIACLWAFSMAWLMFTLLSFWIRLRVKTSDERKGLDYTEHFEVAYPEFQQNLLHSGKR